MADYDDSLTLRLQALGASLRERRVAVGLSQEQLAHTADLHRTYVGAVERGERNISIGSLFRLADALGTSPKALLS